MALLAGQVRVIGDPTVINKIILALQKDGARVVTRNDRAARDSETDLLSRFVVIYD